MKDRQEILRVGIAGYGVVGRRRRIVIDQHPYLQVVSVSDKKFKKRSVEDGIQFYSDYRQILDEDIDVIFICLPNYEAPLATISALEHGCHVFCEKPPGRNLTDIRNVIRVKEKYPKAKLMYGFNHRYHESIRDALKIIQSKELGKLINLRGIYGKSGFFGAAGPDWRADRKRSGGGILLDQGIHLVDILRLLAGEFQEIKSFVENSFWGKEVEDNAYAMLRTHNGVVATLHSSATQWQHKFELEIALEKGLILLSGILSGSKSYGEEKITVLRRVNDDAKFSEKTTRYRRDNSWRDEIDDFVAAITENKQIKNGTVEQALKSMELVFRIYCADPAWRDKFDIDCSIPV
jgi:predicted dehydrogenase